MPVLHHGHRLPFREKIRSIVKDPGTAEALCPKDHYFGTKRPCLDTGYFETYNLPHVRLVDLRKQPIISITQDGIETADESFGPDGAVRAVFDWELATSGDPMADLGWLAATWQDPGEQLPPATPGPSAVAGFPARAQLVQRYARLSGRDVSDLPYWVAFSRWRSACIGVGVRARYLAGHMGDDGFAARFLTSAEPGSAGSRVVLAEAARDALRDGGP